MLSPARDYAAMSESALVQSAQSGERDAFRAIMQRCNQRLFRVARGVLGNDDEAEDVVQESYLLAFAGIESFRGDSAVLTWLTAIVLNAARGRLRKRHNMVELQVMDQAEGRVIPFPGMTVASNPEAEAARSQTRYLLEKAIDGLPENFRLVYILCDIEGCSGEEAATQLGLKPETVKTRLYRARQKLRNDLEDTLSNALSGTFPFLGQRCVRMTETVLEKMQL